MREYGAQAVVWQTAVNPVVALELLAAGTWQGAGVLGPEAFDAGALPRQARRLRHPVGDARAVGPGRYEPSPGCRGDGAGMALSMRTAAMAAAVGKQIAVQDPGPGRSAVDEQRQFVLEKGRPDVFIAGDDAQAKAAVAAFITSLGLRPLDVGGLKMAHWLEGLGVVTVGLAGNGVGHWDFALGVNEFTG